MISTTSTPQTSPLLDQLQSFITGVLHLDPEEAAIRAGLTLLVLIGAMLLIWGLRQVMKALADRVGANGAKSGHPSSIGKWSLRIARWLIIAAGAVAIARVWGIGIEHLTQGPVGAFLGGALRVALVLALTFAAIELLQALILRSFGRIADRAQTPRRASQIRTLAPLLNGVITATLIVIAAMTALSQIGVEIGPLIAGAGIVGLAVGFGAQTLVKDFLTGVFLILEDIVSVGDVVMIQDFGGVVEEMSLRTIKLRDFDGTLHVFPYSEAQVIHNRTKTFSFAVFDLSVDYGADIAKALEVMRDVGAELRRDENFAPHVLDDIEVVGVDRLADSAVMLKGRLKTQPGKQWLVQREYLKRIKIAFDEARIEIPFPHLKLVAPDPPAGH